VTVVPPGLKVRCTCGFPEPITVTVTVVVAPAASVPDIGETTTFLARPGGSRTVQSTGPPEAVSVIVPVAGGTTSSVVGLTRSVPVVGAVVTVADVGADGEALGCATVALGDGWPPLAPALGRAVLPALRVAAGTAPLATGTVPDVLPSAGCPAW
jgi:hypothetical protein